MLAFFAHILVNMGFAWLVWGLIACSLLTSPSISFCSHLDLMLVLPLGILVGLYAGFGNFDNNSGCFALLLVVGICWLVHLLPTLCRRVLSLILAPPGLGTATTPGISKDIQFMNSLGTTDILV
jgi:hypothetical protein